MLKSNVGIKILALIVTLTVIANISVLDFELGNIYYIILISSLILLLIRGKKPKFRGLVLWLIAAALMSIFANEIPYFFRPYERLIAFVLVIALIGPFIFSQQLKIFRWQLFNLFNKLLVILIFISFLGLVLNLPFAFMGRGGFTGVFNHSMITSPFAAICIMFTLNQAIITKSKYKKAMYYFLSIFAFIVCLTAGSRAALSSVFLAILFYFYLYYRKNIKKSIKVVLFIIGIGILSFPIWEQYTERVISKLKHTEEQGDITITRTDLWLRRINEFKTSPVFGIGYSNDSSQSINDLYKGTGQVEPGSSWLAVLAMTGIIGFIPFILIIYRSIILIVNNKMFNHSLPFLGSLLVFFSSHMIAEGYVLSAGSALFFYFWLLLGIISSLEIENSIINKNEKI